MSVENVVRNRNQLVKTVGKAGLNIAYPDDFELYIFAFELLASNGNTIKYFIFPVNPSNIRESSTFITKVTKTTGGVQVLRSDQFIPTDISVSGSFGRKFRVLLGSDYKDFVQSLSFGLDGSKPQFDARIKTGYGTCKVLESICNDSISVSPESGGPKTLIFHNLALGNSYVVEVVNLTFEQSESSNMIWNYNLTLKSIAPLSHFQTRKQNQKNAFNLILTNAIQGSVDSLVNELTMNLAKGEQNLNTQLRT